MSKAELVYQNQPASNKEVVGEEVEELSDEQIIGLILRKSLDKMMKGKLYRRDDGLFSLNMTTSLIDAEIEIDDFTPLDFLELAEEVSSRFPYGFVCVDLANGSYVLKDGIYHKKYMKFPATRLERACFEY